jgi:hypothetical protein
VSVQQQVKQPEPKPDPNREFVLGTIKGAICRLDEIRQEMINAGTALRAGLISPQMAIDWCEEVCPGGLSFIPPSTGLAIKKRGSA